MDHMSTTSSTSTSSSVPHSIFIHHDIHCNECLICPIVGVRYKSIPKDNYNLCMSCEAKIFSENFHTASPYYPMIKITHPSQHPKHVTYTINDYLTYQHHNEEFKSIHLHSSTDYITPLTDEAGIMVDNLAKLMETSKVSDPLEVSKASFLENGMRSGKPIAGSTFPKAPIQEDPNAKPPMHTWNVLDHQQFQVRIGPDYNRNKKKAPSAPSLYEAIGVDVFRTKARIDHVAPRFHLPDVSSIQTNHPKVPPLFIVQLQIPSEAPPFFSTVEDGPGWSVVMYFRITESTCNQLKNLSTASAAVKLFAEWCEKSPTDVNWRGRFKVICASSNLGSIGVPSAIESYNGKPVLIRKTGTIFSGSTYLEKDIHVHKFANIAKQSIFLLSSRCSKLYMQIGFVIEGRENPELPETILGCVGINLPQDELTLEIFDDY